jgi:hypothetical protein
MQEEPAEINQGFTDVSSMTPSKSGSSDGMDSLPNQALYEATKQPTGNVLGVSTKLGSPNLAVAGSKPSPSAEATNAITKARHALPSFVELHGATSDKNAPPECKQC